MYLRNKRRHARPSVQDHLLARKVLARAFPRVRLLLLFYFILFFGEKFYNFFFQSRVPPVFAPQLVSAPAGLRPLAAVQSSELFLSSKDLTLRVTKVHSNDPRFVVTLPVGLDVSRFFILFCSVLFLATKAAC